MTEIEQYELLILGGGKAGKTLAMDMARAGRRVAVIERGLIGGSCINLACVPYSAFRDGILAHPTMAEGLNLLFSNVPQVQQTSFKSDRAAQ